MNPINNWYSFARKFADTLDPVNSANDSQIEDPYSLVDNVDFAEVLSRELEKRINFWKIVPVEFIKTKLFEIVADASQSPNTRIQAANCIAGLQSGSSPSENASEKIDELVAALKDD